MGPDFIPNEEPKVLNQRRSAGRILQESKPPLNIRQLKPNILHQKYIETSQINNIPGPSITKRTEDKKTGVDYDQNNNNKNCYKYYSKSYYDNISNNQNMKKKSYALKNTDIVPKESIQRF